jgi:hypothetical protein
MRGIKIAELSFCVPAALGTLKVQRSWYRVGVLLLYNIY